ncbi:MAG: hypothetical protein ACMUJM_21745 [bacterium]
MNHAGTIGYTGIANFYMINCILRDNTTAGSNIYAGPYNVYLVHNAFDGNGNPDSNYSYNLRITSDGCDDEFI